MKNKAKHAPTPYRVSRGGVVLGRNDAQWLVMHNAVWVALCSTEADAVFLACAANAHESLLAACKAAMQQHRLERPQLFGTDSLEETLRAAIAKAD